MSNNIYINSLLTHIFTRVYGVSYGPKFVSLGRNFFSEVVLEVYWISLRIVPPNNRYLFPAPK